MLVSVSLPSEFDIRVPVVNAIIGNKNYEEIPILFRMGFGSIASRGRLTIS